MTQPTTVLVLADGDDPQLRMLEGLPHIIGNDPAVFAEAAQQDTIILHWSASRDLLRSVFNQCQRLHWVHSRSAGLDSMLFPELVESPVPLTNGTGVFSQSLGEFALMGMLFFAKDMRRLLRNQAAGRWEQFDVDELRGQTVGIVGYGDIGRAIATRAHAMGMHVLALKRHAPQTADAIVDRYYQPSDLRTMIPLCDYIAVAAPLTPETRHMLSTKEFAIMKQTAVVINVGRGPVIDQKALVQALKEKRIRGAALDVFEHEPLPDGDPIYSLDNVLVSPHSADHTRDWLDQAMQFFLRQYDLFRQGKPLQNVVDKKLGY